MNTFRRIEQKYLLNEEEKNNLFNIINNYLEKDTYYQSTIENIYFDTKNNDLIIKSIEKPLFKEKVRLRSYNIPNNNDYVFLEIKNKYKGVVGKRRIKITLEDYYKFINNSEFDKNNQIAKEIDYHIKYYNLYPKIFIAYDRLSFKGKKDNNLRITLDSNLRYRYKNLKLEQGSDGKKYFDNPHYIMEIKTLGSLPLWLTNILSELKIYPKSFSKYGNIYKKESGVKC